MNVLLTHERFLPDFGGGGEYIVFRTATGLLARGVNVRVLTTGDPALRCYQGVPTERLPISRYAFNLQVGPIAAQARARVDPHFRLSCLPAVIARGQARGPASGVRDTWAVRTSLAGNEGAAHRSGVRGMGAVSGQPSL